MAWCSIASALGCSPTPYAATDRRFRGPSARATSPTSASCRSCTRARPIGTSPSRTFCSTRSLREHENAIGRSSGWRTSTRTDTSDLRAAADYLHSNGIPFGFGVSPYYRDPQGRQDEPRELALRDAPELVATLKYLQRKGGVLVGHGYTHQWDGASNPYNGITGDDVEFYRVTETKDGQVQQLGPLPGDDSAAWAEHRIVAANREFEAAGISPPRIFEFPHYAASDRGYRAARGLCGSLGAQHVLPRPPRR